MQTAKKIRNEAWSRLEASREAEEAERRRSLIYEAFELAQVAEAVARHEDSSAPEAAQLSYCLYLIKRGHFAAVRYLEVATDAAALAVAYAVYDACSELFEDFELWQGSRQVAGNAQTRGPRPSDSPAGVSARARECLLDTVESLLFSRRAIAESRKLLSSTDKLRATIRREQQRT